MIEIFTLLYFLETCIYPFFRGNYLRLFFLTKKIAWVVNLTILIFRTIFLFKNLWLWIFNLEHMIVKKITFWPEKNKNSRRLVHGWKAQWPLLGHILCSLKSTSHINSPSNVQHTTQLWCSHLAMAWRDSHLKVFI